MTSTVTFDPVGRLGNFLFESASCMAYAWDHEINFVLPNRTNDAYWNPVYLAHLSGQLDPNRPKVVVQERQFNHHVREFRTTWRQGYTIYLNGYWQTEKYFKKYRERILEQFRYPWIKAGKLVSVHVRRGDYLKIQKKVGGRTIFKHPPVTKEWYLQQMAKFPKHVFAFYSDDIAWCKENFGTLGDQVMFAPRWTGPCGDFKATPEEQDLVCMSCCEHHICSASTFSWWGAWLNRSPKKRVIMPKHWITPGWSDLDFSDVVPEGWERA